MKRAALCVLLPLCVLIGRLWIDARHHLAEAAVAAQHADEQAVRERIVALGRAARLLPFGPSETARTALATLARQGAEGAWSELRASILATRWLLTPDRGLLDEANHAIAEQRARKVLAEGRKSQLLEVDVQRQAAVELALLTEVHEPSRALSIVALAGLTLFLYGVARALDGERRLIPVGALGLALFVVGLAYA
ncbi:MAG: hypothetical protein ABI321_02765 [Polyangia bacterium]